MVATAPNKRPPSPRYGPDGKRIGFVPPDRQREVERREVESQIRLLARAKAAQDARERFMPFVKFTQPDPADPSDVRRSSYDDQRHHRAIARVLEEVEKGTIPFLILTIPPRHGKSELGSRRFPAWLIGRNPRRQIVVAAYNQEFAEDFGAEVRAIMATPQYRQVFPDAKLRRGGAAKDRIQTVQGGMLVFVGRGGALVGRGADFLILDDLIKDAEEARSPAIRDGVWQWFIKVAMTRRMHAKAPVVLIMQRWHEDDPVGRLTDPTNPNYNAIEASRWKIINLPAIAEDDDPLKRAPGEPLWPESKGVPKFDLEFLRSQQRLDPIGFSALYQQRPTTEDGILFRREHIQYYQPEQLPADLSIYATSDHAVGTDRARHDATVLLVGGLDRQSNLYLLDCFWDRSPTDQVVERMLYLASRYKPLLWGAERGHISKSIGPFLRKRMEETGTWFALHELTPSANKEQRAQAIAGRVATGKVYFPRASIWTEKAIDEMMKFPNGRNDDFVDALAYFGILLQNMFSAGAPSRKAGDGIPKFGTVAWLKWADKLEKQDEARRGGGY